MAAQLPWELEEETLSRLPPLSLVRFRTVCKKWNSLFRDKSFLKKYHLSHFRPQFIILTNSKVYSIDIIDLDIKSIYTTIELRELPSFDIPCDNTIFNHATITTCDEVLFYYFDFWKNKTALWNPWLRQVRCIKPKDKEFNVVGIGYDNTRPEKVYKILGYFDSYMRVAIYECASKALKFIDTPDQDCTMTVSVRRSNVSLNGNLYWITRNRETLEYFIQSFDFLKENFKPFGILPCQKNHTYKDQLIIAVYKGDRFSLLAQCCETKEIEIWVMKKKIDREEEEVVWINFMTLPTTTTLPRLSWEFDHISYFIYDKTLFMCCSKRETGVACIYIVRKDLCKKIQIDHGIIYCCHCVYTPNLISIPLL